MTKALQCLLQFHVRRLLTNDEGQRYTMCSWCSAYRDFTLVAGAS
jgi:hypothetical protein